MNQVPNISQNMNLSSKGMKKCWQKNIQESRTNEVSEGRGLEKEPNYSTHPDERIEKTKRRGRKPKGITFVEKKKLKYSGEE